MNNNNNHRHPPNPHQGQWQKSIPQPLVIKGVASGHVMPIRHEYQPAPNHYLPGNTPQLFDPRNVPYSIGLLPDAQQKQSLPNDSNMSPRGKHAKPPVYICRCTDIVAWMALILGFFAIVMLAIIYFNWQGGPLTGPVIVARKESIQMIERERMDEMYLVHNHTHYVNFRLKQQEIPDQTFIRYPSIGVVEGLKYNTLANMRLCCHVGDSYFICDYGRGAIDNLSLECVVMQDGDNGAYLMIVLEGSHKNMEDPLCTFTWESLDMKSEQSPRMIDAIAEE